MIDAGLVTVLEGAAAVTAICAGRIFQGDAPPDLAQLPCVTYTFVGGSSTPTLTTSGVIRQRVELNGLSLASGQAKDLAAAAMQAVIAWAGGVQANGVNVLSTELVNPGTDFVSEQRIFRRMVEFYVLYTLQHS